VRTEAGTHARNRYPGSLGWKFSLVLILTVALFGISAFLVGHGMELARNRMEQKDLIQERLLAAAELQTLYLRKELALEQYRLSASGDHFARWEELSAEVRGRIDALLREEPSEERRQLLEVLRERESAYRELLAADPGPSGEAERLRDEALALMDRLIGEEKPRLSALVDQTYSQLRGNNTALVFSIVVSAAVGLVLVWLVSRRVRRSLQQVVRMADEIAGKNLLVPDMDHFERDEIGRLAESMNRMKETLQHMMAQIANAARTVAGESRKLTAVTGQVGAGSREMSATMEALAHRSRDQAETSADLSGRMDRFSGRISSVVHEKDELGSLSARMRSLTEEGSASMETSIEKMEAIDASIEQSLAVVKDLHEKTGHISEIVLVIRQYADQTKLLALNASIEAAKAGEHGRSFSVVAENVRKLSEQVQESAGHITEVLETIRRESARAVASLESGYGEIAEGRMLIDRTSETFRRLKEEIGQIGRQIGSMSSSLDEVGEQTGHIREFLRGTAALSEQTAAGVSEVSAIAGEFLRFLGEVESSVAYLDQEAGRLNGMVQQFKTGSGGQDTV